MIKQIPIAIALVLLLASAFVQGMWSERWRTFPELDSYAKRLKNVPMDIADWRGEDGPPMDERTKNVAGAVGALNRKYTNSTLGVSVTLDLVCGRPRDMMNHTPERCYPAAGWERNGKQSNTKIEGVDADFFTNAYMKLEPSGTQNLRVYWSWSTNGQWEAPENFKLNFAAQPSLYKLYVMVPATNNKQSVEHNPAIEFIRVLLPELQKALFNQAQPTTKPGPPTGAAINATTGAATDAKATETTGRSGDGT